MTNESQKAFEKLIDKACTDAIFKAVSDYIEDNFEGLDLADRSNVIEEVQEASLDDLQIIRVEKIEQEDDVVKFDVVVNCEIVIEETVRRDRQVDSASQWFSVKCSAILDGFFKKFTVVSIDMYSR